MGGSKTTTTSSNTIDPELMRLYRENYDRASQIADRPYQPYTGERVAGFTPLQQQGMDALNSIANNNIGADSLNYARSIYGDLANYHAPVLTSPGTLNAKNVDVGTVTAPTVTAGQIKDTDLTPYMNPFTQGVIDTTMSDLARQRDIQRVKDSQAATASKAFGGSRQGVADSLTNDAYLRNVASTSASLRSTAYDRATENAIADINRRLNTDEFNAGNAYDANKTNVANRFAADTYNSTAGTNADKYNLDMAASLAQSNATNDALAAQLRGNVASNLGALSSQELSQAMQRAGLLTSVGTMQQQMQQQLDDSAYEKFMQEWSYPLLQQQMRNAALGQMPVQSTQTQTSSSSPGGLDILGTILGGASAAGSLGWAPFSDMRTKDNVRTVGYDPKGRRWVDFNYKWDDPAVVHRGVIAQEILQSDPGAVLVDPGTGLYRVDYSQLTGEQ